LAKGAHLDGCIFTLGSKTCDLCARNPKLADGLAAVNVKAYRYF
jgi:hypothetical protein